MSLKTEMRLAEKERKKKFSVRILFILNPGKKIPKKIAGKFKKLKNQIGRERETKIFVPNSVHTRPGQENSEKNSKKIKKPYSDIIFSQNGMG